MTRFLAPDWFDLLAAAGRALPIVEDASADLVVSIPKTPDGDLRVHLVVEDGQLVASAVDLAAEAPLELTCPYALAVDIVCGASSVSVAFMRGDLKVNGDMGAMHRVLPLTDDVPFEDMLAGLAARTDF